MRSGIFAALLAGVALATACGDPTKTVSPTPVDSGANTAARAVVAGTVHSSAASLLLVQVVGTNLSAPTTSQGQFKISDVPPGNVELRFTGSGIDARLTVGVVAAGETVTIDVQVTSATTVVRTDNSNGNNGGNGNNTGNGNNEVRVTGAMDRLTGTQASFTFVVGSRQVRGNAQTQFTGQGPSAQGFSNLRDGRVVEVRGSLNADVLVATRIHFEDNDADDPDDEADDPDDDDDEDDEDEDEDRLEVELKGAIGGLSSVSACPSITFTVSGRTIFTNGATEFDKVSCSALANGTRVEVKGFREADNRVRARRVRRD